MYDYLIGFANILMVLTSLFLICLVLIQRGKGGGLAGAFGGAGGSSAFGTKAGDVFTRVTIIVAGFWFLLALLLVYSNNRGGARSKFGEDEPITNSIPVTDSDSSGRQTPTTDGKSKVPPIPVPADLGKDTPILPITPGAEKAPATPGAEKTPASPPVLPPTPDTSKKDATPAAPPAAPTDAAPKPKS